MNPKTFKLRKTGEIVYVSNTVEADLPDMDALAASVHFEIGLETWKIYFETSHENWLCIRNSKQELIGYINSNSMPIGMKFGFHCVIREDYQNLGVGRILHPKEERMMGNASSETLIRSFQGQGIYWQKMLDFNGIIHQTFPILHRRGQNFHTENLNAADIDQLVNYDNQMTLQSREKFLKLWCLDAKSEACIVAKSNGKIVGYGVLRKFTFYHGLTPLYADSDEIAEALFWNLLNAGPNTKWIQFPCIASNRKAVELGTKAGLRIFSSEMRTAHETMKEYHKALPLQKCFALQEFWPL